MLHLPTLFATEAVYEAIHGWRCAVQGSVQAEKEVVLLEGKEGGFLVELSANVQNVEVQAIAGGDRVAGRRRARLVAGGKALAISEFMIEVVVVWCDGDSWRLLIMTIFWRKTYKCLILAIGLREYVYYIAAHHFLQDLGTYLGRQSEQGRIVLVACEAVHQL